MSVRLVGGALAMGLALFQFWGDWVQIGLIAGIFAVGQFLEGNVITPRLVGNSVGLHPVWLLFALSAFGAAFGFVGMLVAVPVAAMIGVLVRFGIQQYQESLLYKGIDQDKRRRRAGRVTDQLAFNLPCRQCSDTGRVFRSPANEAWPWPRWTTGSDWPLGKMVLIGPRGAGKTHLAHIWAADSGATLLAADSTDQRRYCPIWWHSGPVVVEDAERLAGECRSPKRPCSICTTWLPKKAMPF